MTMQRFPYTPMPPFSGGMPILNVSLAYAKCSLITPALVDSGAAVKRMIQTGHWQKDRTLNRDALVEMLEIRFRTIDMNAAKQDVLPFIKDQQELGLWGSDFFCEIIKDLDVC